MDNGGAGMSPLQNMLMQCGGKCIQILPAWPADWTADFKLHAPYQTTVEGHVEQGKLSNLTVISADRTKDVVVVQPKAMRWTPKTGPQVKMDFHWSAGEEKADDESKTQTA